MRKTMSLPLLALFSAAVIAFPRPAIAEPYRLSVDNAVRIAVERNLGLQVETYNPAIAATDIRRARSIYDPTLSALLDHQGSNLQAAPESPLVDRRRLFDFDASISQMLSSGATASASFTNLGFKDTLGFKNNPGVPTSRFAQPALTLSLSQPLLKGLGK